MRPGDEGDGGTVRGIALAAAQARAEREAIPILVWEELRPGGDPPVFRLLPMETVPGSGWGLIGVGRPGRGAIRPIVAGYRCLVGHGVMKGPLQDPEPPCAVCHQRTVLVQVTG